MARTRRRVGDRPEIVTRPLSPARVALPSLSVSLGHPGTRLRSRTLLYEQDLAVRVVRAAAGEHEGELERKRERAVEVLMQAVVAAGGVAEEQRGGPGLPVSRAAREVHAQLGGKAL